MNFQIALGPRAVRSPFREIHVQSLNEIGQFFFERCEIESSFVEFPLVGEMLDTLT